MNLSARAVAIIIVGAVGFLGLGAGGAEAMTWSAPTPVATAPPFSLYGAAAGVSCVSSRLCVGVDTYGDVLTSTAPSTGAWSRTKVLTGRIKLYPVTSTRAFTAVACPSRKLCVASDNHGDLVTSDHPTGGASAWRVRRPAALRGTSAGAIACPSTRLCVAALRNGRVAVSTHPLGGSGAWSRIRLGAHRVSARSISCSSRRLCVVSAAKGSQTVALSGAGRPSGVVRDPGPSLKSLSCPSASLCVGLTEAAQVVFVRHPGRGGARWRGTSANYADADAIDCPSPKLCVAAVVGNTITAEIVTSTRPTAGAKAWHPVKTSGPPNAFAIPALTCASQRLCVGLDNAGGALSSTRPAGRNQLWQIAGADGQNSLSGVSCASASACVAIGPTTAVATEEVGGPAAAWRQTSAARGNAIACPTVSLCVATDTSANVTTSNDPLVADPSWTTGTVVPGGFDVCPHDFACENDTINHLACPSVSLCVEFGSDSTPSGGPYSASSTNPAAGAATWSTDAPPSFNGGAVACPATTRCVAVGKGAAGAGYIGTTSTPADGGSWSSAAVDTPGATLTGIACPTTTFCTAVDDQGAVLTSTNPVSPASWVRTAIDPGHALNAVACSSPALCVAVDDRGTALQSTTPTGGAGSWSATSIESGTDLVGNPIELLGASCPSDQRCVLTDSIGNVIVGTA